MLTKAVLQARQLYSVLRLSPYLLVADCAITALLNWFFHGQIPTDVMTTWMGAVWLVAALLVCLWWRRYRRGPPVEGGSGDVILAGALAVAVAGLYGGAAGFMVGKVDAGGQEIIIATAAGLISAGAFARATVPPVALGWVLALNIGSIAGLLSLPGSASGVIIILLGTYDIVVVICVLSLSEMYIARLNSEAAAARQEQVIGLLLHDFEDHASNWLWESDQVGRLTRVSARMGQVLEQQPDDLLGVELSRLLTGAGRGTVSSDPPEAIRLLQRFLLGSEPFRELVVPAAIGGEIRWWVLSAKPIRNIAGAKVGWRGVGGDITESRRYEEKLRELASRDGLTGLLNRVRLQEALDEVLRGPDASCALLLLDLDNFKAVNDTLGHSVGDDLLRLLANRLQTALGPAVALARLGGDEFAVVLKGNLSEEDLRGRALSLLNRLRDPCLIGDARIEIKSSIGIAIGPHHGKTADQLFMNADVALYVAKDAGGDRAQLFGEALGEQVRHRAAMIADLGVALRDGQFFLVYQPQVESQRGTVVAFEALLRWRHPERGMISPDRFIPLAEETGQIVAIGAWVIEQACRDALLWGDDIKIAVNVSAVQLNSRGIVETVKASIDQIGFPPARLELEITETALVQDAATARTILDDFRQWGIGVALDDFGVGYSMLSYLRSFPLDKLKIDQSFVATLTEDSDAATRAIFRAIMDMAKALSLRTVAEGVDNEEKLFAVQMEKCSAIQGYLIGKPMPAADVPAFLAEWRGW
jgi:diguanylate cyclase (GGDEF)-like protein